MLFIPSILNKLIQFHNLTALASFGINRSIFGFIRFMVTNSCASLERIGDFSFISCKLEIALQSCHCSLFILHIIHLEFQLRNKSKCCGAQHSQVKCRSKVGLTWPSCLFCCLGAGQAFPLFSISLPYIFALCCSICLHLNDTSNTLKALSCFINVFQLVSCLHTDKLDKRIFVKQEINQIPKISSNFCRCLYSALPLRDICT